MKKPTQFQLLLMVVVAALLGLSVYIAVVIFQQASAAADIGEQIALVDKDIAKVSSQYDVDALEAELQELESQVEESQFPGADDVENVIVLDLVITAEHNATVQIASFAPDTPKVVYLSGSGTQYLAYPYEVVVTAAGLPQVYSFLGEVEGNTPYATLVVNDVEVEYYPPTEDQAAYWLMGCDIVVYALP